MTRTAAILKKLRAFESRNVTFIEPDGSWPIVWEKARGVYVWDAEGKRYLDLTAAFGVAATGHANPRVVKAGQRQMGNLLHAMGDVHPHALKADLARELSRITFERWTAVAKSSVAANVSSRQVSAAQERRHPGASPATGKTIFCNSGFEAVEAALKTAVLATGKRGVIAFTGAYHGLGYGTLNATHRGHFRRPFLSQLAEFGHFVTFPIQRCSSRRQEAHPDANAKSEPPHVGCYVEALIEAERAIRGLFKKSKIGAILVEPVQGRGGINVPPPDFLPMLRQLCDEHGALLIVDEVLTGFGRTGKWFACEHTHTVPDLICLGKALTGGFPLSACVGRAEVMDAAWPESDGEAIHTSTFLGHPVGCAMALAQIQEIKQRRLVERSEHLGTILLTALQSQIANNQSPDTARGLGLMAGLELLRSNGSPATEEALTAVKTMLHRGYILLPEGEHSNIISFTPPLTITEAQLRRTVRELGRVLLQLGR